LASADSLALRGDGTCTFSSNHGVFGHSFLL
jgi:hypothetical protein